VVDDFSEVFSMICLFDNEELVEFCERFAMFGIALLSVGAYDHLSALLG